MNLAGISRPMRWRIGLNDDIGRVLSCLSTSAGAGLYQSGTSGAVTFSRLIKN